MKKCLEETYKCKTGKTTGQDSRGQVHLQAAKSQAKSLQKLDETGVMVAGCRHALMQKAVNMWTGELYGYGLYLQKNVLEPIGVKYLFYDVIMQILALDEEYLYCIQSVCRRKYLNSCFGPNAWKVA